MTYLLTFIAGVAVGYAIEAIVEMLSDEWFFYMFGSSAFYVALF